MNDRSSIYSSLHLKMEDAGFVFELEQTAYMQNRKEKELKFVHPLLKKQLELNGQVVRGEKFYIKPLSDAQDCEIGLTNGKTSTLFDLEIFAKPNDVDTKDNNGAWVNKPNDNTLDTLLQQIKNYIGIVDDVPIPKPPIGEKNPEKVSNTTITYKRDQQIVDWVYANANGICESCGEQAPFNDTNNKPFLEVHHVKHLAEGGSDTITNTVAICPNCHRELHFGMNYIEKKNLIYEKVKRLIPE